MAQSLEAATRAALAPGPPLQQCGGMITRFAPSPTGLLHIGHAFAAQTASDLAHARGGTFLLRIEDIDFTRCRPEFETAIFEDLSWLGFDWPQPVWRQTDRFPVYADALEKLRHLGVLYPCFCTRQEIAAAITAPQGGTPPLYPGTCRDRSAGERQDHICSGRPFAWRLDTARALELTGPLMWHDQLLGQQVVDLSTLGDVVLARRDISTSYHLSVTIDDAAQNVSVVSRGLDLFTSTNVHRLLQELLQLAVPQWHHHPLILDETGNRLAKRDAGRSLRSLREAGYCPEQIRAMFPSSR